MTKHFKIRCTIAFLVFTGFTALLMLSCGGCGSGKLAQNVNNQISESATEKQNNNNTEVSDTSSGVSVNNTASYSEPKLTIKRNYLGKVINLGVNPEHPGGEAWTTIWEEDIHDPLFERKNRICQLSPTVLLYRRFPSEVAKNFFYLDQPEKIEFLDSTYKTIKTVDIWKNRPYQGLKNAKMTYWNFDGEAMGTIPYSEQKSPITPNEYSLFTHVRSEGNHVIVNYELRYIKNSKQWGMETSDVVAVKHTLHIYDLQGNLKYELKDLPSIDEAVVSNDGRYMMYVFGGMGLATANSPFGTIERPGWALMRLEDQKIVYQEYTDDGKLAFNRLSMQQSLLHNAYSTPSNDIDYDRMIFLIKLTLQYILRI
ncbi:MAG: hypothetical protein IPM26_04760 [Saprospiraceae bacterium]|nr:hypothetical protein [Saprospiraceae bacterium]